MPDAIRVSAAFVDPGAMTDSFHVYGSALVVEDCEETIVSDSQLVLIGSDQAPKEMVRVLRGLLSLRDYPGSDLSVEAVQVANRAIRPSDCPGGQRPSRLFTRSWSTTRPSFKSSRASSSPTRNAAV